MATDPNLRRTRLVAGAIVIAAVLAVAGVLKGTEFVAFASGLLGLAA